MNILLYIVANVVIIFLSVLELAMLLRAILSMFMVDGIIIAVLIAFTEPFILPIRLLFKKLNLFQGSPLDFSGLVAMVLISVITIVLIRV